LRQTPEAEPAQQDQRGRGCAEPRKYAVGPPRRMTPELLGVARRFAPRRGIIPFDGPALTGAPRTASVPAPAGPTG
jgi:hypothetical protein